MTLKNLITKLAQKAGSEAAKQAANLVPSRGQGVLYAICTDYNEANHMLTIISPLPPYEKVLVPWTPDDTDSVNGSDPKTALENYDMLGVEDLTGVTAQNLYDVIDWLVTNEQISTDTARFARLVVDQRHWLNCERSGDKPLEFNRNYQDQILVEVVYSPSGWAQSKAKSIINLDMTSPEGSTLSSLPVGSGHKFQTSGLNSTSLGGIDDNKSPADYEQIKYYKQSINGGSKAPYYVGVSNDKDPCA